MPGMYYGLWWDPTYFLIVLGVLLSLAASGYMNSTYSRFTQVRSRSGMNGAMAAGRLLQMAGIGDVRIEKVGGNLTDHYDPKNKVLRLSEGVYSGTSVAALGVAAHECGHAIQHARGYKPLALRSWLVPAANFGSKLSWPVILIGVLLGYSEVLITLGIALFSLAVLFQLVTLPVEFNASSRAAVALVDGRILSQEEVGSTKKVLRAAALTYVASAAGMILQLLRLILLFGGNRRNDRR